MHLLFYRTEGSNFSDYTLISKWCSVYGVTPVVLDLEAKSPRVLNTPPYNFRALNDALKHKDLKDKTWIWLDHRAKHYWDEVKLPTKNVIYCIGHDISGFQNYRGENLIKVRCPNKKMQDGQWFASMVAAMLLFEVHKR